jgi:MerR family transcriptional regulator, light-induced transcriptional regulator
LPGCSIPRVSAARGDSATILQLAKEVQITRMADQTELNIGALARRSGVPTATLRAWERRYGVPAPRRTPGGRRVYSDLDLTTVLRMRQLVAEGVAPARAASMLAADSTLAAPPEISDRLARGFAERFVDACVRYDDVGANAVLDEALAVYPVESACLKVFVPSLSRIGDLWREGGLPVATEHLASGLIRDRLAVLMRAASSSPEAGLIVLGCAPGEHHEIGPLMMSVFLRRRGWRVLTLGANTPLDEIDRVVAILEPRAIIISATQEAVGRRAYERCLVLAVQLARHSTILALGGQGAEMLPREQTPEHIVILPKDLLQAVALLERVLTSR